MTFQRTVGHAIVVAYLILVFLGAAHAVRRLSPVPFGRVTVFMYGMLAPYQGYSETTEAYLAEGLLDGAWRPIDLSPYYPVLPGERSMREQHHHANWAQFPSQADADRAYAGKLLESERVAGRPYERVRLSWIQWRPSPESYRAPSSAPLRSAVLVTVP